MIDNKIKYYSWDICGMEDYEMIIHEIDVLKDIYGITNFIEVHNKGQVIAIMAEVH